jgi:hypothetical protein
MANSETILSAENAPSDSSTLTITGEKYKGDGYYSRADGFHTVQINVNNLIGTVTIQATLATTPTDTDWTDVVTHTATDGDSTRTGSFLYNFTGNHVWVRSVVEFSDGTVNSITLNH